MIRAVLLTVAATALTLTHGDAAWIQSNPRYKIRNSETHCCGPDHCKRIPRAEVAVTPDGYVVHGALFPHAEFEDGKGALYASIDHDYWLCEWSGEPKCLFTPEGSS